MLNPPHWIVRVIAATKGETRIPQSQEIITQSHAQIIDRRNGFHGAYMELFNEPELASLESAADCLRAAIPPSKNRRDSNNHFGRMRTMNKENFLLKDSNSQPVLDFINAISIPILAKVTFLLHKSYSFNLILLKIEAVMTYMVPHIVTAMKEHAFCGIFPAFTIVTMNSESKQGELHVDKGDAKWALCAVVYFGNFTEGGLDFPGINVTLLPQRGGLALFNSGNLYHQVLKCQGVRKCLVLFVPATLYFPPKQK